MSDVSPMTRDLARGIIETTLRRMARDFLANSISVPPKLDGEGGNAPDQELADTVQDQLQKLQVHVSFYDTTEF